MSAIQTVISLIKVGIIIETDFKETKDLFFYYFNQCLANFLEVKFTTHWLNTL